MSARKRTRRPPAASPAAIGPVATTPAGIAALSDPFRRAWILWSAVAVLVVAYLGQTFSTLATTAPTYDEVAHLPAGYAELQTGHVVFNPEHPPLAKLIAAVSLGSAGGKLDDLNPQWRDLNEWTFGQTFLFQPGRDPAVLLTRARRGPIVVGLLLCLTCFLWSYRLYGPAGAVFTLALSVFCPTILAHARLVATDVPVAAFGVLAAYLVWETLVRPSVPIAVAAGIALGACFASKFSGVILAPGMFVAVVIACRHRTASEQQRIALLGIGTVLAAVLVVAATYGWPLSLAGYIAGFGHVRDHESAVYFSFLLGSFRTTSFPLYFPTAFLIKTSPALLIAIVMLAALVPMRQAGLAVRTAVRGPDPRVMIWCCIAIYTGFIMLTAWNIGVRYLIPIYPFLLVAVGAAGAELWRTKPGRAVVGAILVLQVMAAVRAWPDPISYFNGLFGCDGPLAVHCLRDSNFDWGQDIGRAAIVADSMRKPGELVVLDYFGSADPRAYLDNAQAFRDDDLRAPAPMLYVVSAADLNLRMWRAGLTNAENWFNRYRPARVVGNTYLIYDFRAGSTH